MQEVRHQPWVLITNIVENLRQQSQLWFLSKSPGTWNKPKPPEGVSVSVSVMSSKSSASPHSYIPPFSKHGLELWGLTTSATHRFSPRQDDVESKQQQQIFIHQPGKLGGCSMKHRHAQLEKKSAVSQDLDFFSPVFSL